MNLMDLMNLMRMNLKVDLLYFWSLFPYYGYKFQEALWNRAVPIIDTNKTLIMVLTAKYFIYLCIS